MLGSVHKPPPGSNTGPCCKAACSAVQVEVGGHRFSTEVRRKNKLSKEQLLAEAERKQQERQALQHSAEGQVTAGCHDRLLAGVLAAAVLDGGCAGSGCAAQHTRSCSEWTCPGSLWLCRSCGPAFSANLGE